MPRPNNYNSGNEKNVLDNSKDDVFFEVVDRYLKKIKIFLTC
jgi:hypothetical protein